MFLDETDNVATLATGPTTIALAARIDVEGRMVIVVERTEAFIRLPLLPQADVRADDFHDVVGLFDLILQRFPVVRQEAPEAGESDKRTNGQKAVGSPFSPGGFPLVLLQGGVSGGSRFFENRPARRYPRSRPNREEPSRTENKPLLVRQTTRCKPVLSRHAKVAMPGNPSTRARLPPRSGALSPLFSRVVSCAKDSGKMGPCAGKL